MITLDPGEILRNLRPGDRHQCLRPPGALRGRGSEQAGGRRRRELDRFPRRQDPSPSSCVPNQENSPSGAPITADDHGLVAAARRHPGQDAGIPLHPARLEQGQRKGPDPGNRRPTHLLSRSPRIFAAFAGAEPHEHALPASVVEKKIAMSHEEKGDLGNAWLKTHSAGSGSYNLGVLEGRMSP